MGSMASAAASAEADDAGRKRTIELYQPDPERNNAVQTSRFTLVNCVPKFLFEQLTQVTNAYFLCIAVLQLFPSVSNTGGIPAELFPLTAVLLMAAAKDYVEDRQRRHLDTQRNNALVVVVDRDGRERQMQSKELRPGMLFKLRDGDVVPADALLLATADEDGRCFVETANLDGETNLKSKSVAMARESWKQAGSTGLVLTCEAPHADLYKFHGTVRCNGEKIPAVVNNLLLAGTTVRQVPWVIAMATYCGHETRAMLNSREATYKSSRLDDQVQKVMLSILAFLLTTCLFTSVGSYIWSQDVEEKCWYLFPHDLRGAAAEKLSYRYIIVRFFIWFVQLSSMIPVSLIVTVGSEKYLLGRLLTWDEKCCDPKGGRPAGVNVCQVLESLGLVTHVFSDKTGTLTKNVMDYKACAVGDRCYGLESAGPGGWAAPRMVRAPNVDFEGSAFFRDLEHPEAGGSRHLELAEFLLVHALCHTVEVSSTAPMPSKHESDDVLGTVRSLGDTEVESKPAYKASSPDELALVSWARSIGLEFLRLREGRMELAVEGGALAAALADVCGWPAASTSGPEASQSVGFELLDTCPFDNDRKRMSVIVRYPDGSIVLLCKGADSSVIPFATAGVKASLEAQLLGFAREGLRTLVLATRRLREEEWREWHERYADAQATLGDAQAERIAALASEIEEAGSQLKVVGCTAIDDRLQDEVPATIQQLRDAGLRVWVLTGDKVETAISIATSCRLLTEEMSNFVLDSTDLSELTQVLASEDFLDCQKPALTISGAALAVLLDDPELARRFADLAQRCKVVVGCRVSPKQKADVVQLIRNHVPEAMTLAVGDGANDVSMLIAAHVGVGISGLEGTQAAISADFSITEFRYLRRLLFVHGRENYRRLTYLELYFFYKNFLVNLPVVIEAATSGFSGENVFNPLLVQLHNVFYTQMPICCFGLLDRCVANLDDLESVVDGYGKVIFSYPKVFAWALAAAVQAMLYSFTYFALLGNGRTDAGFDLSGGGVAGDIRLIWTVIGVQLTLGRFLSSWYALSPVPFLFCVSAVLLSFPWLHRAGEANHWNITWDAVTGPDCWRIAQATVITMFGHCLVDEALLHHGAWVEQPLASLLGRVQACCRPREPKPADTKGDSGPRPSSSRGARSRAAKEPLLDDGRAAQFSLSPPGARTARKSSIRPSSGFAFAQEDLLDTMERRPSASRPRPTLGILRKSASSPGAGSPDFEIEMARRGP